MLMPSSVLATVFLTDGFEDGTLDKWSAIGGGKGFQISTAYFHSGSYGAQSNYSLGDGICKQWTSPPTIAYLRIWIYYNGSRTNAGDCRIITLQNTTSGRGVSIKHHLYNGGRDVLTIFDEWTGTSTDSTHDLTYNTWHMLVFAVMSSNNTANLYVDGVLEASKTIALLNEVCNELDIYEDDATFGSYYYRMWIDDIRWADEGEGGEPPPTSLLTIRALDPQGNNLSMPFMLDGMWNSTFFSYDMALANYSISFPSAWNFNGSHTWNFINWTDYGGGGYFYTERIIIFTEETQYTVYYSISRNWDPGGWVNFILGLIGFGLMFFSWIFGYGLWKDDEYAKAIGVWLGMFTIGLGIFTVMLGG